MSPEHSTAENENTREANELAQWVAQRFDLGRLIAPPEEIFGGLSNRLWRLRTSSGDYALKQMLANATAADFGQNIEAAAKVEYAAFEAGLPLPEPVRLPGHINVLAQNPNIDPPGFVRVHRWIDGQPIIAESATVDELHEIGRLLGQIHRLPLTVDIAPLATPEPYEGHDWSTILDVAPDISGALPIVTRLEDLLGQARSRGGQSIVLAHQDMDAKNFLRTRSGLQLIDWDAAGPTAQVENLVSTALDWSGIREGAPVPERFEAIVGGYRETEIDPVIVDRAAYAGWIEQTLDWIWFNIDRSRLPDQTFYKLALQEVSSNLKAVLRLATMLDLTVPVNPPACWPIER